MAIFQLDFARFITVYVGQGIFFVFYMFIAYKILKRDRRRLNLIFSSYYLIIAFALLINFIYAPIPNSDVQRVLNTLTNYLIFFGLIFLVLFDLLLLKKEVISNIYLILIISIYGILLAFIMFMNPESVKIGPSTNWRPVWHFMYFLHLLLLKTIAIVIPTFIIQILLYFRFHIKELKKKWLFFNVGTAGLFSFSYGVMTANYLDDPTFRLIISLYSIFILLWGYLIYYGVGKQIGN